MRPLADGSLVVGAESGVVTYLDPAGRAVWSEELDGPVYDIGAAEGDETLLAVGHGASWLTGLDTRGRRIWQTDIEREPCPWPWWELPTPAPVQVEGSIFEGAAFFAVGCGDIQIRGFDGAGRELWRQALQRGRARAYPGGGRERVRRTGDRRRWRVAQRHVQMPRPGSAR